MTPNRNILQSAILTLFPKTINFSWGMQLFVDPCWGLAFSVKVVVLVSVAVVVVSVVVVVVVVVLVVVLVWRRYIETSPLVL